MTTRLPVIVYFDLVCPWCFIGKRNLDAAIAMLAEAEHGVRVEVDWRSTELLPDTPAAGLDYAAFYEGRLGGPEAVRRRQAQVQTAAQSAGLDIVFGRITRLPNTARAHRLLDYARGVGEPDRYDVLLERLFAAYFQDGLDIGDPDTLAALVAECGLNPDEARARIEGSDLRGDGALRNFPPSVPLYVFNDATSAAGAQPPQFLCARMRAALARTRAAARAPTH